MRNPPTTEARQIQGVSYNDSEDNEICSFAGVKPTIKAEKPASAVSKSYLLDNSAFGTSTGITLTYRTVNQMPATATFKITYPSTAGFGNFDPTCYV